MITVRCPNCEATYQLDESKLADGGRKLKCAKCQTVWIAKAEAPAPAEAPVADKTPEGETEAAAPAEGPTETPAAEAPAPDAEADDIPPPTEDLIERTPGLEAIVNVGGWRQWVRGDNVWRTGALVLIGIGLLAGAGVAVMKLMASHPAPAADVHENAPVAPVAAEGLAVVQPPKGVVLHRVHGEVTEIAGERGGVALTVRGLLTNTTSASVVVPSLRLELLGDQGQVADMWPVSNVSGTLGPMDEQAWSVSLSAPDMSAVKGWRVVFVSDKAQELPAAPAHEPGH